MKKQLYRAALVAAMLLLSASLFTGCDFIRASLGKPTSADLALLRQAEQERARAAEPAPVPDTATAPAPAPESATEFAPAPAPETARVRQYYAVAGAFKEESGVKLFSEKLEGKGFRVCLLDLKSGMTAVCLEGRDSIGEVRQDVAALKAAGFDAWIYNSNQKLHK
jgi:hypothetical protein